MFDNIGAKIKGMAKFFCWFGIIASVLFGFGIIALSNNPYAGSGVVVSGIITMVAGAISSWLGSLVLYGFGQLVEDVAALRFRSEEPPRPLNNQGTI